MEKTIFQGDKINVQEIIFLAIKEKLASSINYQEVHRIIGTVIDQRQDELVALLNKCFDKVLTDKKFQDVIVEEFRHKVAKNLVAKLEGAIEKNVNKFRQDPILNSKMILAIEGIINDAENKESLLPSNSKVV